MAAKIAVAGAKGGETAGMKQGGFWTEDVVFAPQEEHKHRGRYIHCQNITGKIKQRWMYTRSVRW